MVTMTIAITITTNHFTLKPITIKIFYLMGLFTPGVQEK